MLRGKVYIERENSRLKGQSEQKAQRREPQDLEGKTGSGTRKVDTIHTAETLRWREDDEVQDATGGQQIVSKLCHNQKT